jgi:hypothetical protein
MTPEQIKALQDEMNRNFTEFKATLATQTEETKKYGHTRCPTRKRS